MTRVKRQRSIFEFLLSKKVHTEVVDLTADDDDNETHHEYKSPTKNPKCDQSVLTDTTIALDIPLANKDQQLIVPTTEDPVLCPLCDNDITALSIEFRTMHVDKCLSWDSGTPSETPNERPPIVADVKPEIPKATASKFANKDVDYENYLAYSKEIKHPKTIKRSLKSKREIPQIKVLTFSSDYKVAVDAFAYRPHAEISQYFLTHFHSDHYGGISKNWCYEHVFPDLQFVESEMRHIIYCTPITSRLLTFRFGIHKSFIRELLLDTKHYVHEYEEGKGGLYVTPITANHCPGAAIFLFESYYNGKIERFLHCGDFRVNKEILCHPLLASFNIHSPDNLHLDKVYLDTTYLQPNYTFPKQELVCKSLADMFHELSHNSESSLAASWFGIFKQSRITDFFVKREKKKKFLILVGTYVIGKEKLAIAILRKTGCGIFALNVCSRGDKLKILRLYDSPELNELLTTDDLDTKNTESECMVHLVPMSIVGNPSDMASYFNDNGYYKNFERCIGIRPTGWTFLSRFAKPKIPVDATMSEKLHSLCDILINDTPFDYEMDILPQCKMHDVSKRAKAYDSTYRTYSVPYSEHSSFRELAFFTIFFNIDKVIPTVNIENPSKITEMTDLIQLFERIRQFKLSELSHDDLSMKFSDISLDTF